VTSARLHGSAQHKFRAHRAPLVLSLAEEGDCLSHLLGNPIRPSFRLNRLVHECKLHSRAPYDGIIACVARALDCVR
jgi:hypothetical protein